jgi:hypothetical protein
MAKPRIATPGVVLAAWSLLTGAALGLGQRTTDEKAPANDSPPSAPEAILVTGERTASDAASASEERKWEVDERGERYYVERLEKTRGYRALEDGKVRTPWGIVVETSGEDDKYYYVRVYDHSSVETLKHSPPTFTPEQVEAVAATYPPPLAALGVSHRLAFEPFDRGLPRSGQWRNGFRLADLNGDGALDLVHGPARKRIGPPLVFLGDRRGSWRRWAEASFPSFPYDYGDVAVADFDGNGTLDLALAAHLRGVVVLTHDGKGGFSLRSEGIPYQTTASDPPVFSSRAIVATDWDSDGDVDLLAAGDGPRMEAESLKHAALGIAWYRNRGNATWERTGETSAAFFGESLALADLDGDGDSDLIAGSNRGESNELLVFSEGESNWSRVALPQARLGYSPAAAAGDFDRDGRQDVALSFQTYEAGSWRVGLDLHLQRAQGWERRGVWADPGRTRIASLGAGELDGDGRTDLIAATVDGRVVVLRNDGGGSFTREDVELVEPREACSGFHVEIADLDGDGRGDLAVAFSGEDGRPPLAAAASAAGEERGCDNEGSLRVWRTLLAKSQ